MSGSFGGPILDVNEPGFFSDENMNALGEPASATDMSDKAPLPDGIDDEGNLSNG
mgnify:CR=1 FL=1